MARSTIYKDIAHDIRMRIVDGPYKPGDALPSRSEMSEHFSVGVATVQRAMEALLRDGFIRATPGSGTVVADEPPHLRNVGIVFPYEPTESRFFMALQESSRAMEREKGSYHFRSYVTEDEHSGSFGKDRLESDVKGHRVGALIFATPPFKLVGTEAMNHPGMPHVVLQSGSGLNSSGVYPDMDSFLTRAIDYMHSRGRKRLAHLCIDAMHHPPEILIDDLKARGVEVRPYWVQSVPHAHLLRAGASIVNLLMQLEGDKRPDGLIVHDDNLVQHAIAGLLSAGTRVPEELEVVSHSNFPSLAPSSLPISRLGFDSKSLLKKCIECIEAQRNRRPTFKSIMLGAQFSHELGTDPVWTEHQV